MLSRFGRYTQAAGIINYATVQWLLLVYFTTVGGLVDAGNFSLAQAVAMPIFSIFSFGLRQWWVGGVIPGLSPASLLSIRVFTSFVAVALSLLLVDVFGLSIPPEILVVVLIVKFHEAISDAIYGALDVVGRSTAAGLLLIGKGVVLSLVCILATLVAIEPQSMTVALVVAVLMVLMCELRSIWPIGLPDSVTQLCRNVSATLWPLLAFTGLSALLVTIQGYLPRYGLILFSTRAELGYYALVSIPTIVMVMIATGLCQSSLRQYRQDLRRKTLFKKVEAGIKSILPLVTAASAVSVAVLFLSVAEIKLPVNSLTAQDMYYIGVMSLLSIPLIIAQFLSYFVTPLGRPGLLLIVNTVSLFSAAIFMQPLIHWDPIIGAGVIIATGGVFQCMGFLAMLYVSQSDLQ